MGRSSYEYQEPYTRERLMKLYKQRAKELGHTPTSSEFSHRQAAIVLFGSFTQLQIEAGLRPNMLGRVKDREGFMKKEIWDIYRKLGRRPNVNEYTRSHLVFDLYGSWENFLMATGILQDLLEKHKKSRKDKPNSQPLPDIIDRR